MTEPHHYPPEVFRLLVDTIPLLCRSKQDVILFFQGAGVSEEDLANVAHLVRTNRNAINKYEIVRETLTKINSRGDSGLRPRREIIKRVTEFENFDTCWDSDRLKAKGLVSELGKTVHVKDSFTRMKQERDSERDRQIAQRSQQQAEAIEKRSKIDSVNKRLSALFGMDDKPHERGKLLEVVLNDLFRAYNIHIREDFKRRDPDSSVVLEQIDGVIELDGTLHLVEMKWLKEPVGVAEIAPHLVRLFGRANASGIFIATNGYTEPAVKECMSALSKRTIFLCSLREIVMLLQNQSDLIAFLRKKSRAAIIEKNPWESVVV